MRTWHRMERHLFLACTPVPTHQPSTACILRVHIFSNDPEHVYTEYTYLDVYILVDTSLEACTNGDFSCYSKLSFDRTKHYYSSRNCVGWWSAQSEMTMKLGFSREAGEAQVDLAAGSHWEASLAPGNSQGHLKGSRGLGHSCTLERQGLSTNYYRIFKIHLPSLCLCFRLFCEVQT